ncbi:mde5 [Symbiodinium sp. CCMP2592]|nr:mde5 [Symbiodinium sp. CCMP2592]
MRRFVVLLLLAKVLGEPGCENGACPDKEPSSLMMLRQKPTEYIPRDIKGKSLYFIVTDYFADPHTYPPPSDADCAPQGWCNGTIKGITNHLDYIQGMGFEGIWITPAVLQFYGPDPDKQSGFGSYGYWAKDIYKIDPSFGTEKDLKALADELHRRDMVFVYDIVLNHVGPVHDEKTLATFHPFNKPEYINQLGRGNLTFDEYARGKAYGGTSFWPPTQAMGPGAICGSNFDSCENFRCRVDPGFGNPCPSEADEILLDKRPGPATIPFCNVGDLICEGYDEPTTISGWFYDLGDLNQSNPFVRSQLIKWGKYMKNKYHIDGFRLDTAPYVPRDFLSEFQAAVGIPILGEVTASNWTFFKSYAPGQASPDKPVLKGLLNFYVHFRATPAFCGLPFWPGANLDFNLLSAAIRMVFEDNPGAVHDLNLLGNFVDNHDMQRIGLYCKGDVSRMRNAVAWTMMMQGMPIIFYGTEHGFNTTHPPQWNAGFSTTTPGYSFLQALNNIRKALKLHTATMKVESVRANQLVISRRSDAEAFIFLNNYEDGHGPVEYEVGGILPETPEGWVWADALHGYSVPDLSAGVLRTSTDPVVLTLVERFALLERDPEKEAILVERL